MSITIVQGSNHKLEPAYINIVIDVIRAFTVAHYAFLRGAKEIQLVNTVEAAKKAKEADSELMLAGEVKGLPIQGFDLDNSPHGLQQRNVENKILIQKTTNGVKAALNSLAAEHILVTGYSNAKTTAEYAKRLLSETGENASVHLIASHPSGDDDLACALYIKGILEGSFSPSQTETEERILHSSAAEKFHDKLQPAFCREDIQLCAAELKSDFVMKISPASGDRPKIWRVNV
ncbi:2-phosphosulfolactate phosphatase [Bacillus lacus]|uniref:Probable 2-phosphosulfolactate phosphatase n=1 Tax=Metabacillus lacus TaxID=1983721 RepID=A0A7X2IZ70_9BACI|nr:2-phosphosulfolactate phosphatase [Metabacillus lacus]MRX72482.1 2-phosphosulfolactate phosphatase [Metabacillus lacus]